MLKQKILLIFLGIIVGVVLTLATIKIISVATNNGKLKVEDCIGTWEVFEYTQGDVSIYYMPTIEIYKGGTARGSDRKNGNAYHPFNWEIKDDMLVLTETSSVFSTGSSKSYEINGNLMKAVDGSVSFKKNSK